MNYRLFLTASWCLLAACSASATSPAPQTPAGIGAAGGTVVSADGLARLEVPAGALTSTVALTLSPATSVPLDPAVVGSAVYTVSPPGVMFAASATLRVTFTASLRPAGSAESELRVHRLESGVWSAPSGQVDTGAHAVSTGISTSGSYAVRWPAPAEACSLPEDRHFDFWIGEWTFTQTMPAGPPGVNSITRDTLGCLIHENFNGGLGRSISFFSRIDQRWHQTYIDTGGRRIAMSGRFEDGRMRLQDTPNTRWTWERTNATTVRYYGEAFVNGAWQVGFDSRYTVR